VFSLHVQAILHLKNHIEEEEEEEEEEDEEEEEEVVVVVRWRRKKRRRRRRCCVDVCVCTLHAPCLSIECSLYI
jgi:hypothetical protein